MLCSRRRRASSPSIRVDEHKSCHSSSQTPRHSSQSERPRGLAGVGLGPDAGYRQRPVPLHTRNTVSTASALQVTPSNDSRQQTKLGQQGKPERCPRKDNLSSFKHDDTNMDDTVFGTPLLHRMKCRSQRRGNHVGPEHSSAGTERLSEQKSPQRSSDLNVENKSFSQSPTRNRIQANSSSSPPYVAAPAARNFPRQPATHIQSVSVGQNQEHHEADIRQWYSSVSGQASTIWNKLADMMNECLPGDSESNN